MKPIKQALTGLFIFGLLLSASLANAQDGNGNDKKDKGRVTICHVAGNSDDPSNYVTITISVNGLNGHFKDGSPRAGHESDFMGPCPINPDDTETAGNTAVSSDSFVPMEIGVSDCNDILVYHTDVTGDWEIFRLGNNDRRQVNVSQGAEATDLHPSLSPDRKWVAFTSNRDGNWEIFAARTNGTFIQQLTFNETDDTNPVWSPTGNQIVYQSNESGSENLVVLDVMTGEETALTHGSVNNVNPYWSPDGNKIIFNRENDGVQHIFELTVASQEVRQLTTGNISTIDAQYSPDGQWITYRQVTAGPDRSMIYIMTMTNLSSIAISDPNSNALNPAWSPQSNLLAYESNREGDSNIYIYDMATTTTRRLTGNASADFAPTWYCGTTMLVFASDVMGNTDLFTLDALPITDASVDIQTGLGQLTSSDAAETYPQSSPLDEDGSRAILDETN